MDQTTLDALMAKVDSLRDTSLKRQQDKSQRDHDTFNAKRSRPQSHRENPWGDDLSFGSGEGDLPRAWSTAEVWLTHPSVNMDSSPTPFGTGFNDQTSSPSPLHFASRRRSQLLSQRHHTSSPVLGQIPDTGGLQNHRSNLQMSENGVNSHNFHQELDEYGDHRWEAEGALEAVGEAENNLKEFSEVLTWFSGIALDINADFVSVAPANAAREVDPELKTESFVPNKHNIALIPLSRLRA